MVVSLLFCCSAGAQILSSIMVDKKAGGSFGPGGWTLISHTIQTGSGNDVTVPTSFINCTGADLYVIATTSYMGAPSGARYQVGVDGTDFPAGNVTGYAVSTASVRVGVFWVEGITGASAVAFSVHNNYGAVYASCWAGAAAASAKDQESASGAVTCFPCSPSLTPTMNGTLALIIADTDTTINTVSASGFTLLDQNPDSSASWPSYLFYKVLGSGTSGIAQSATVTSSPTDTGAVKIVNFKHQ